MSKNNMEKEYLKQLKSKFENSHALFYGELEYYLDNYLPNFFKVTVRDVGFNEDHPMNTLEFWFTVSLLVEIGLLDYGTSPRGACLTDEGEKFKEFINNGGTITSLLHNQEN